MFILHFHQTLEFSNRQDYRRHRIDISIAMSIISRDRPEDGVKGMNTCIANELHLEQRI